MHGAPPAPSDDPTAGGADFALADPVAAAAAAAAAARANLAAAATAAVPDLSLVSAMAVAVGDAVDDPRVLAAASIATAPPVAIVVPASGTPASGTSGTSGTKRKIGTSGINTPPRPKANNRKAPSINQKRGNFRDSAAV